MWVVVSCLNAHVMCRITTCFCTLLSLSKGVTTESLTEGWRLQAISAPPHVMCTCSALVLQTPPYSLHYWAASCELSFWREPLAYSPPQAWANKMNISFLKKKKYYLSWKSSSVRINKGLSLGVIPASQLGDLATTNGHGAALHYILLPLVQSGAVQDLSVAYAPANPKRAVRIIWIPLALTGTL